MFSAITSLIIFLLRIPYIRIRILHYFTLLRLKNVMSCQVYLNVKALWGFPYKKVNGPFFIIITIIVVG